MLRFSILLLATALATACTASNDGGDDACSGGKCDDTTATRITFDDDFDEELAGELVAGGSVTIDYDLDRLTECRGSTGGSEVWGVTGWVSYDGGSPASFALSQLEGGRVVAVEATLAIPEDATSMALWFSNQNRWGCVAYDSDHGANYGFDVATPEAGDTIVVDFAADGSFDVSGAVRAGDQLVVHYEPARLEECAGSQGGYPQWGITGYYQVDGGSVRTLAVTRAQGSELVPADPAITVPAGRDIAFWFEATSTYGCHAWDSDFGANYHVAIE